MPTAYAIGDVRLVVEEIRYSEEGQNGNGYYEMSTSHIRGPFTVAQVACFEPTAATWERAAGVLRDLRDREGLELRRVPRSFGQDILLACSCRELGITLVTDNARDFKRIATVFKFRWRLPWPPTR